jgi:hypothetical protein
MGRLEEFELAFPAESIIGENVSDSLFSNKLFAGWN